MQPQVDMVNPPNSELVSTGPAKVDEAILALIKAMESRFPDLGYYLHGSWASDSATPASDVDVLALATIPVSDRDHDILTYFALSDTAKVSGGEEWPEFQWIEPTDLEVLQREAHEGRGSENLDSVLHGMFMNLDRLRKLAILDADE